ncbi:SigE family RNA polymerase sigma factor [Streptomyces odontomachi]|uniref:SigE family RNA polymerase sigma factor n=1 Tax=Streptomyces odontomachi TaxID=2944940 RepID=UPI002109F89D|nr:SigE family RNA polymerase sigma factor [Streptomyces sp. ODS25]
MPRSDPQATTDGPDCEFTRFVATRWRALTHTAFLLTGDFHEAEDLVQTTLARVYPHWRRIRSETAEHYVRRALVNANRSRHRRRRIVHFLLPVLPDTRPAREDGTGVGGVAEHDALVRVLSQLPRRQRAVLVLRYCEDLSAEETADILGCSVGTVKSQASRALAKLRSHPDLARDSLTSRLGEAR